MGLAEVSRILWRERELLEMLLFTLEQQQQLVLGAGRTRWSSRTTREVEIVLAEIRRTEVARAVRVDAVAEALGLGPSPGLSLLADAVDEPWRTVLQDHRHAFLQATAEVTALAATRRVVTPSLAEFLR